MSPAPVIVGPEAENKRQSKYAMLILAIVALALFATAYVARDMYEHPTPSADCTGGLEYVGTCARADTPAPTPPPSTTALYLGTLATAIIAIILIQAGWSASVTKQAEIVTAFSGSPAASTPAAAPATTATSVATATTINTAHPIANKNSAALATKAPITIVANKIAPDMIAPPKVIPKKGVDAKVVEGTSNG